PGKTAGVCLDHTGIDRKAFAAHQASIHASPNNQLKYMSENVALAEAPMAILRERRMIRNFVIEPKTAEPPVSQVQGHLFTETAFRADAVAIAYDQHPDHQLR